MKYLVVSFLSLFVTYSFSQNTFKDTRDNIEYKTVEINGLTWMAENLQFRPKKTSLEAINVYNDSIHMKDSTQGYFYAIADFSKVIPKGWRLPTMADVKKLYEKNSADPTAMFPEADAIPYLVKNASGTNATGFSADKSGCLDLDQYKNLKEQSKRAKNGNSNSFDAFSAAIDKAENKTYHPISDKMTGWYCKDDYNDVVYFYVYHKTNKFLTARSGRNMPYAFKLRLVKM